MPGAHLSFPQGREAGSARWAARHEECSVAKPHNRRETRRSARRAASRKGLEPQRRTTSLPALPMTTGIGRGSRLVSDAVGPNAALGDS
jgi:hypothetical protein